MNRPEAPLTLLVAGPTASGKSALSVELAGALGGEIVNIDSVQVYRGADIGSAKMTPEEQRGIPHHLLDILEPHERLDAAFLSREARRVAEEIRARGRLPILVGSSGMYISALYSGLASLPPRNDEVRKALESRPTRELHERLSSVDPLLAARLHPNDKVRIVRALETFELTGVAASTLYAEQPKDEPFVRGLVVVLVRPREELYRRIDERAGRMVEEGLVEETDRILSIAGGAAPALRTLGYAQSVRMLEGTLDGRLLAEDIALHTRRYAKRQMTFWRNEPRKRGWRTFPCEGEGESVGDTGLRAFSWSREELRDRIAARMKLPFESTEAWYVAG